MLEFNGWLTAGFVPGETKARVLPGWRVRLAIVSVFEAPMPMPLVELMVLWPPVRVIGPTVSVDDAPAVLFPR